MFAKGSTKWATHLSITENEQTDWLRILLKYFLLFKYEILSAGKWIDNNQTSFCL